MLALLIAISACAPRSLELRPPNVTAGFCDDHFVSVDGAQLPIRLYGPYASTPVAAPTQNLRAILVGLHGFNDYRLAFDLVGPLFAEKNIMLVAYDQRGFGASPGAGIWAGRDNLVRDASAFVQVLKTNHPQTPIFILGESMGAAITAVVSAEPVLDGKLDGIILSAPAVWGWSQMNFFYRSSLWATAHLFPKMTLTGSGLERVASDNREALVAMYHDPLVIKETRVDSVYGLVGLMDEAFDLATQLSVPTLVLFGERDDIVPRGPVDAFVARLPQTAEVTFFPEGYHLLLRDSIRQDVVDRISDFIASSSALARTH